MSTTGTAAETNFEYWWPKNLTPTATQQHGQMFTACGNPCEDPDPTDEPVDDVYSDYETGSKTDGTDFDDDDDAATTDNEYWEDDAWEQKNGDTKSNDGGGGDDDDDDDDVIGKFKAANGRKKHTVHEYVMSSVLLNNNIVRKRYFVKATSFKGAARKLIVKVCRGEIFIPDNSTKTIPFSKMQMYRIRPITYARLARLIGVNKKSEVPAKFIKLNPDQWPEIFVKLAHQYSGRVHFYNTKDAIKTRIGNTNTTVRVQVEIGAPNSKAAKRFANVLNNNSKRSRAV